MTATTSSTISNRVGRLTSSTISSSKAFRVEPVPIILEICSTVLRVGYAGNSRPQHLINMDNAIFENDDHHEVKSIYASDANKERNNKKSKTKTESEWYLILSPLIEQVFDRLMCKPRRVVCLYSNKRYAPLSFQKAIQQHLWNRGVPAMVELDQLQCLPISQGWKRGLVVQISREEAVCICHADGQLLPYTYQMIPSGGYKNWLQSQTIDGKTEYVLPQRDPTKDNQNNDDASMSSLVSAILNCLQSCPRDLRLHVAKNVLFCGDGVFLLPDLPRRAMKRVRDILQNNKHVVDKEGNDEHNNMVVDINFASVPIDVTSLRPLASSLSLISCAPLRADWICWVGASLWTAVWNKYSDEETPIPWKYNTLGGGFE
jgi:actin-related protein